MKKIFDRFKNILVITLGAAIAACALEIFLVPNNIIDGGIIGVSIMFTKPEKASAKSNVVPVTAIISAEIFILAFVFVIMFSLATFPDTFHLTEIPQVNSFDVISSFAKGIFINYIWAFEIVSVLLTIVIAGFTLFKKGRAE